jgi:hypothetical protein
MFKIILLDINKEDKNRYKIIISFIVCYEIETSLCVCLDSGALL